MTGVVTRVTSMGSDPLDASLLSKKSKGAFGRAEAALMDMDHIASTDHVYLFDGSENATLLACEIINGRTTVAPGRGGDRDKIKCFKTGKTAGDSVDAVAAILDNL